MRMRQHYRPNPDAKTDESRFRTWLMRQSSLCVADVKEGPRIWDWKARNRSQDPKALDRIEQPWLED